MFSLREKKQERWWSLPNEGWYKLCQEALFFEISLEYWTQNSEYWTQILACSVVQEAQLKPVLFEVLRICFDEN